MLTDEQLAEIEEYNGKRLIPSIDVKNLVSEVKRLKEWNEKLVTLCNGLKTQHLTAMQDLADQTGEALEAKDVEIENLKAEVEMLKELERQIGKYASALGKAHQDVYDLKLEVSRLKEFEWMYKDLCK